jgi:hypothetical protein
MASVDVIGLCFAFMGLSGAGLFFWREKKVAGFAFLVAFLVALASVSQQRIVLSSLAVAITVEKKSEN